ncbi:TetR family transcriptional regulator [Mycobacterium adipatum]|jgi:AcrR family transcriptional regulator|uniref:TetR family transcriptional regulator n=1 Tax=Mycobacterium adipatum TaxID=1682113 RepID=UPI000B0A5221|nr:TetR family transcriptional regulator [Mycobacterium adipatum]MBI5734363.1 TetR family transcriptional regulator [Mycolicibacterium neoaurum]
MAVGVRERARLALRTEIAQAMSDLFAARGFDAVTVEEAAGQVGISRATFFRYFGSKEDAVLAAVEASSIDYAAHLQSLPPLDGETPWQLLLRAFKDAIAEQGEHSDLERSRALMINSTVSLRTRMAQRRFALEDALTPVLAGRMDAPEAARAVVTTALAGLDLAWRRWAAGDEPTVARSLDRVFEHLDTANSPLTIAPRT